jgi:hypothetical protein
VTTSPKGGMYLAVRDCLVFTAMRIVTCPHSVFTAVKLATLPHPARAPSDFGGAAREF